MSILRARCPTCHGLTAVAIGDGYECHACGRTFAAGLVRVPRAWGDGGEIAAVVRNDPDRNGGGLVGALGVRRAWRGRGLGRALLLHTFGEFHRRGTGRVTLGVDSSNPTGATQLYESVGMHVELENVVWEKILA